MGDLILAASKSSSGGGSYVFLLAIVVLFGLLYFVTIRPQRNRQRAAMQTQREVGPGARVRTTAGMYATVVEVDGDDVVLEVAPGVEVRYLRRAIMEVVGGGMDTPAEPAEYEEDEAEAEPAAEDSHTPADDALKPTNGAANPEGAAEAEKERPAG